MTAEYHETPRAKQAATNGRVNPAVDLHRPLGVGETRNLTDMGNAERFVDRHRRHARYCYAWGTWLIFDGKRWAVDDDGNAERLMQETVRRIYAEAASETDDARRRELVKHAKRSETRARITDALWLARSFLPVATEELDADPYLLNCENGTVDLRTGKLRDHRLEDYITKLAAPCDDLLAKPPVFCEFLKKILPTADLRNFVQAVFGYAAIGVNTEQVLPILHGSGANGKSTLINAVMEALGDYAMQAAPDLLVAKKGAHPTELADLFGARFVASVETDDGRHLNEGLVKQLTGGDRIKARRMRQDFWEFDPTHTVILATNHKPEVRGTDHAIWRRLKLVPFDVTIPDAEQDKKLPEKLREELPAILAWIVRGALMYQKMGLPEPDEVRGATATYRSDMDVLGGFITERCVVGDGMWAKFADLYADYAAWCDEAHEKAENRRRFGTLLKERGFEPDRGTGNAPIRRGIALREDRDPDPDRGPDSYRSGEDSAETDATNGTNNADRVTISADSYPTVTGTFPDTYAENPESSYRSYPKNHINSLEIPREETNRNHGNLSNLGNFAPSFTPHEGGDVAAMVARLIRQNGRIRLALLCTAVADEGMRGFDVPRIVEELGCTIERLPEYGNERFVYAPQEWAS